MTRLALAFVLAACGNSSASYPVTQQDVTESNATAHDRARDDLLLRANGAPFVPSIAVVEMNQEAMPTGGITGLRPGEGLYALPDGELALMPHTCIRGSSCGCEVSREYTYLKKPDGSVVVARLTPVIHVREVKVERCSSGCGTPAEPTLRSAARLGVRQTSGIQFAEATFPYELVVETCDHPIPAP